MKQFIKRLFGIDKIEAAKAYADVERVQAEEKLAQIKMTPKERATKKGEPWISVTDTKVNMDNPRNGFFELDWNSFFITELKKNGYGFDDDPEEEIVDRWFRDIVYNMLSDEGLDTNRGSGFINVTKLADGKAAVE